MTELHLRQALAGLPHGPEFRFLDRITDLEAGVRGCGEYRVRGDEPFLPGHFPGAPMMPGVLMIEAAAQLAGCVAQSDSTQASPGTLKLTAVRSIKILGSARPGDTLMLEARVTGRMAQLVQAQVTAHVAGELVLDGHIVLAGESTAGPAAARP